MAKIFRPKSSNKNRKHLSAAKQLPDFVADIEKYDHELKAISQAQDGRITFITGAIKGETVKVRPTHYTQRLIHADTIDVITPSPNRVTPPCAHFGTCGGCQLQYLSNNLQLTEKQQSLDSLFSKRLGLSSLPWQTPIDSTDKGYRRTARLSVWHDKNNQTTIGFRRLNAKHIIDINSCMVLAPNLTKLVQALRPVIAQLTSRTQISHIQLFALDAKDAMIIRILEKPNTNDLKCLQAFATEHNIELVLQTSKTEFLDLQLKDISASFLLSYSVDKLDLQFQPKDFIQVNDDVNRQMVAQAIDWLNVTKQDTILDLFSGVGNFTLPLAKRAKEVFAVEGVNDMVRRIKTNAAHNSLDNVKAYQADLSEIDDKHKPSWLKPIDKLLLDPARDGAMDVVKKIPLLKPKSILYVSCNPATMLRDLEILQSADYHLTKLGLLNMFPHTHHVEAMALLEYKKA